MRAAAPVVLALLLALPVPAVATVEDRDAVIASFPDSAYAQSTHPLDVNVHELDRNVHELAENISPFESTTTEGQETVVSLSSDILFAFGDAEIGPAAEDKIRELVADIPDGATVQVHGHTDSISGREFNQTLSEERAETVAEIIRTDRPDLDLEVEGFGMDQPVAPNEKNGEDDPEGRALNRRVEIRYEG